MGEKDGELFQSVYDIKIINIYMHIKYILAIVITQ